MAKTISRSQLKEMGGTLSNAKKVDLVNNLVGQGYQIEGLPQSAPKPTASQKQAEARPGGLQAGPARGALAQVAKAGGVPVQEKEGLAKGFAKDWWNNSALAGGVKWMGGMASGAGELAMNEKIQRYNPLRKIEAFGIGEKTKRGAAVGKEAFRKARTETFQPEGWAQKLTSGTLDIGTIFALPEVQFAKGSKMAMWGSKLTKALGGGKKAQIAVKTAKEMTEEAVKFGGLTAVQTGEFGPEAGFSAKLGAAFPMVGGAARIAAKTKFGGKAFELFKASNQKLTEITTKALPAKLLNTLIKPSQKFVQIMGGKLKVNPGAIVAKWKIKGNSIQQIGQNMNALKQRLGKSIGDGITNLSKKGVIDADAIISKSYNTSRIANPQMKVRFENTMDDIYAKIAGENGLQVAIEGRKYVPGFKSAALEKMKKADETMLFRMQQEVGKKTIWGNGAAAEKEFNQAMQNIYFDIGKTLDKKMPKHLIKARKDYSDVKTALEAIEYRTKVEMRNNMMLNMSSMMLGIGGGSYTGEGTMDKFLGAATIMGGVRLAGSAAVRTRLARSLTKAGETQAGVSGLLGKTPQAAQAGASLLRE